MNYKLIEKALTAPVIQSISGISLLTKNDEMHLNGFLYTAYNNSSHMLRIGFTRDEDFAKRITRGKGANFIHHRKGSIREERLLKLTLLELGFCPEKNTDAYTFSFGLIKHLKALGWPTGSLGEEMYSSSNYKKEFN